jgi:hypothetical protein
MEEVDGVKIIRLADPDLVARMVSMRLGALLLYP